MSRFSSQLSRRSRWSTTPSRWSQVLDAARANGTLRWDLTITNPTAAGFIYSPSHYRDLVGPGVESYRPVALGTRTAREAIAQYYEARGRRVDPDQIWITSSTSEAYHHLFFLLADPGDAIGVPSPGYALLDHLAAISGVRLVNYPIGDHGGWFIDVSTIQERLSCEPQMRACVLVSPHNPCGVALDEATLSSLQALEVPLLVDEVFADYPLDAKTVLHVRPSATAPSITLSGLSKVAALPQLKLSWAIVEGPPKWRASLLERADVLADAFLSTNTLVQEALPRLLVAADAMQARIRERCRENLAVLDAFADDAPIDRFEVAGGWTVLVRLPQLQGLDDVGWAVQILHRGGTAVMPGYLFDLDRPPRVALSLLTEPTVFARGVECLLDVVTTECRFDAGPKPKP